MKSNKLTMLAALAITVLFGVSDKAGAQVLLTGGDSTDGWVAPANSVLAYNLNDGGIGGGGDNTTSVSTSQVIQGVTFTSWDGWASVPAVNTTAPTVVGGVTTTSNLDGASYYPEAPNGFGVSANDVGMAALVQTLFYNYPGPLTFSITGLAAGNYVLDEFVMSGDQTRTAQSYSIDGVTTETFDETAQNAYVVENTVTVTGTGPNAGDLNFAISGAVTPELGGFDLSAVVTPEPSTLALMGLGGLGLAFLIRRHRTA
jgi:hypothetical protein